MEDYQLQSRWSEVDSAAQAHKNGFYIPRSEQTPKLEDMTQAVGIDNNGKLWVRPGSGGGGGDSPVLSVNNQVGDVMLRAEDIPADISGSGWQANNVQDALERINEQSSSAGVTSVNGKVGDVSLNAEDIPAQNSGLGYQDVQGGLTKLELKVNEISSNLVSSVNGKTGIVNLTAEDVDAAPESHIDKHASSTDYGHVMVVDSIASGAGPGVVASSSVVFSHINDSSLHVTSTEKSTWNSKSDFSGDYSDLTGKPTIPTKTSQLTNDSGFLTSAPVSSVNGKTGDVQLTAEDVEAAKESYVDNQISIHAKQNASGTQSGHVMIADSQVSGGSSTPVAASARPVFNHIDNGNIHVTQEEKSLWNAKSNFSGNYDDLSGKPTIPTKTSDLSNDSGFLTSAPVSSVNGSTGAVQLTAQDVGADSEGSANSVQSNLNTHAGNATIHITSDDRSNWNAKSDFSGNYSDLSGKPTIPTNTSQLTNDSGFLTSAPVTSVNGETGSVMLSADDVGAAPNSHVDKTATDTTPGHVLIDNSLNSGVYVENYVAAGAIPTFRHINNGGIHVTSAEKNAWDAKSDFSGDYSDLTGKPTIPTKTSQLTNDSGFLTSAPVSSVNGKTGAVLLTAVDVGADTSGSASIVMDNLHIHTDDTTIHVTSGEKATWNAKSDFSGDYNDLLNKPDIPSTASDVGASPTNHRSTGTSYGKGDSTYYGHLKLSAALNSTSGVSSGIAATPSAIKALYDVIKLIDHGTWTPKCASISSPTQAIGTYIIVNDLCVISFCIYGASSSTSTNSLSLRITGLPFEPDSSVKWFGGGGNVTGVRMNANYAFSGFVIEQNATYGAVILPRCVQTSTSAGTRSSGYCVNASGSTMYMAGTIMYRIA